MNLLHVTTLAPRIVSWLLGCWKKSVYLWPNQWNGFRIVTQNISGRKGIWAELKKKNPPVWLMYNMCKIITNNWGEVTLYVYILSCILIISPQFIKEQQV